MKNRFFVLLIVLLTAVPCKKGSATSRETAHTISKYSLGGGLLATLGLSGYIARLNNAIAKAKDPEEKSSLLRQKNLIKKLNMWAVLIAGGGGAGFLATREKKLSEASAEKAVMLGNANAVSPVSVPASAARALESKPMVQQQRPVDPIRVDQLQPFRPAVGLDAPPQETSAIASTKASQPAVIVASLQPSTPDVESGIALESEHAAHQVAEAGGVEAAKQQTRAVRKALVSRRSGAPIPVEWGKAVLPSGSEVILPGTTLVELAQDQDGFQHLQLLLDGKVYRVRTKLQKDVWQTVEQTIPVQVQGRTTLEELEKSVVAAREKTTGVWERLAQQVVEKNGVSVSALPAPKPYDGSPIPLRLLKVNGNPDDFANWGAAVSLEAVMPFIVTGDSQSQISPYDGKPIPAVIVEAARIIGQLAKDAAGYSSVLDNRLRTRFPEDPLVGGLSNVYIGYGVVVKPGNIASVFRAYKIAKYGKAVLKSLRRKKGEPEGAEDRSFTVTPLYLVPVKESSAPGVDWRRPSSYRVLSEKIALQWMHRYDKRPLLEPFATEIRAAVASGGVGDLHMDNINFDPKARRIDFFDMDQSAGSPMMGGLLERTEFPEVFTQLIRNINAAWISVGFSGASYFEKRKVPVPFVRKIQEQFSAEYPVEVELLAKEINKTLDGQVAFNLENLNRYIVSDRYTVDELQERFNEIKKTFALDDQCNLPAAAQDDSKKEQLEQISAGMKQLAARILRMRAV